MKLKAVGGLLVFAGQTVAIQIPAGTELSVRLTIRISSEAPASDQKVLAEVIAPIALDDNVVLAAGARVTGTIRKSKAADKDPARLQVVFTDISNGASHASLSAVLSSLDNARETLDDKGVITGIAPGETFSARIDQGIGKLENNNRLAALAGLIQGAKEILKIQEANPNINYDAGSELTLKLTRPLEWNPTAAGTTAKLEPFPDESALVDLVNRQPFRTVTENSERPSDLTNLMFLATEEELRAAFEKAGWSLATRLDAGSKLETARALIEARGYREGPMSILLLDGRPPEMAYQKGNNTFAQRHHLRIFRRPGTFNGKPVWVCSATHDVGIDFSDRDHTFIHKIDPQIDRERAKVVNDLLYTKMVRSPALVTRPGIPRDAKNATGDPLQTDGSMAVLLFR